MVSILVTLSNSEQSDYKNDKQCCQQYHNDDRIGLVLYIPVTELITHYLLKYNCQMDLQNDQHDKTTDILETHYDFHDSEMIKLEIKSSNLPGSGMGLFASQLISQNQIIAEYYGSVMRTINSNDKEFAHQDKMIQVDNQVCVISRGPASRANDTVKWQPQNYNSVLFKMLRQKSSFPKHKEHTINATISINSKQKAFLKAARPIKPGQQIFIQYGFDYWDFFYKLKLGLHSE